VNEIEMRERKRIRKTNNTSAGGRVEDKMDRDEVRDLRVEKMKSCVTRLGTKKER
jgi:hypothetical protein